MRSRLPTHSHLACHLQRPPRALPTAQVPPPMAQMCSQGVVPPQTPSQWPGVKESSSPLQPLSPSIKWEQSGADGVSAMPQLSLLHPPLFQLSLHKHLEPPESSHHSEPSNAARGPSPNGDTLPLPLLQGWEETAGRHTAKWGLSAQRRPPAPTYVPPLPTVLTTWGPPGYRAGPAGPWEPAAPGCLPSRGQTGAPPTNHSQNVWSLRRDEQAEVAKGDSGGEATAARGPGGDTQVRLEGAAQQSQGDMGRACREGNSTC